MKLEYYLERLDKFKAIRDELESIDPDYRNPELNKDIQNLEKTTSQLIQDELMQEKYRNKKRYERRKKEKQLKEASVKQPVIITNTPIVVPKTELQLIDELNEEITVIEDGDLTEDALYKRNQLQTRVGVLQRKREYKSTDRSNPLGSSDGLNGHKIIIDTQVRKF